MVNQQVCHNDGFLPNCCLISLVGGINQVEYKFFQCHRQAAMLSLTAASYCSAPVRDQPAGSACRARGALGWSLRVLVCTEPRATASWVKGWWDGAEAELCRGSVPGDAPQSTTPSSCSQGDNSWIGDVSLQGCLVSVPAFQWRGDISVCGQAELSDKDLCLLTGRIAFHRKAITHRNKRRSNTSAAN